MNQEEKGSNFHFLHVSDRDQLLILMYYPILSWDPLGDYFLIPLLNGEFVIGQIIGRIEEALNSIVCVYFDAKVKGVEEAHKKISCDLGRQTTAENNLESLRSK